MADIFNHFPIKSSAHDVYQAVSTPAGLDSWWTLTSSGQAKDDAEYEFGFGPGFDWRVRVSSCVPDREFEWKFVSADDDWRGTYIGFTFDEHNGVTQVRFHHTGWPESNDHYRVSCYCWPMYLRLLRRYVEHGEVVPYEDRLDV